VTIVKRAKAERKDHFETVREALVAYLTPGTTADNGFTRAVLIGIVETGPRDLITNKKYLEGFSSFRNKRDVGLNEWTLCLTFHFRMTLCDDST
jgi:hypothetical protein